MGERPESPTKEFYDKTLSIFTDKFTKTLYERQAVAVSKICKHNQAGFVSNEPKHRHFLFW